MNISKESKTNIQLMLCVQLKTSSRTITL